MGCLAVVALLLTAQAAAGAADAPAVRDLTPRPAAPAPIAASLAQATLLANGSAAGAAAEFVGRQQQAGAGACSADAAEEASPPAVWEGEEELEDPMAPCAAGAPCAEVVIEDAAPPQTVERSARAAEGQAASARCPGPHWIITDILSPTWGDEEAGCNSSLAYQ